ncbi:MAG: GLUG motif-containing protein [archaeon]|jgi:hypothetical protein
MLFKKNSLKRSSAQGTIEYLVIIAIVVVIALVVVGMLASINDSQNITQKNDKLKNMIGTGGISVVEAVLDDSGSSLLNLKNNSGETLTITKIETNDGNLYYDQTWVSNNDKLIDVSGLCECVGGEIKKTCEFKIYYNNQFNLEKTITQSVTIDCQNEVPANQTVTLPTNCFNPDNDVIRICSLQDLNQVRNYLSKDYILMKDIDATQTQGWNGGLGWQPIGSPDNNFRGNFDGQNYQINNLYINRPTENDVGLFYRILGGTVENIKLENVNVVGNDYVGGLVGTNWIGNSIIRKCFVEGNVSGHNNVGGLAGYNYSENISKSYFIGDVNGNTFVGGLVGVSYSGNISQTFSKGSVTAYQWAGGLLGSIWNDDGNIIDSYSSSDVNQYISTGFYTSVPALLVAYLQGNINNSYSFGEIVQGNMLNILIGDSSLYDGGLEELESNLFYDYNQNRPVNDECDFGFGLEPCGPEDFWFAKTIDQLTYNYNNENTFSEYDFDDVWAHDTTGNKNDGYPYLKWQDE